MSWRWKYRGWKWKWLFLGEKNSLYYYHASDKVAAARLRMRLDEESEQEDGENWIKAIDRFCEEARAMPVAYIRLPWRTRELPPLLHLKGNGEIWLAREDWPLPTDLVKVGRYPQPTEEATCTFDYVTDIIARKRRSARVDGAYVRVIWRTAPSGPAAIFYFQVHEAEIIVASRA